MFKSLKTPVKTEPQFSLNYLKQLYTTLLNNQYLTNENKGLVIEILRLISELLVWGDQNNEPQIFDFFLEKNILHFFISFATQDGRNQDQRISIQILQTLNILFENLRSETSLYYLLSNNHINALIQHPFDFTQEEIVGYYITFLKTLSMKLNKHTIHFFINEHSSEFPLYTQAIKFYKNRETMVKIAVQTITLNIYSIQDILASYQICRHSASFFFDLSTEIEHSILALKTTLRLITKEISIIQQSTLPITANNLNSTTSQNPNNHQLKLLMQNIADKSFKNIAPISNTTPLSNQIILDSHQIDILIKKSKLDVLFNQFNDQITQHCDKLQYIADILQCCNLNQPSEKITNQKESFQDQNQNPQNLQNLQNYYTLHIGSLLCEILLNNIYVPWFIQPLSRCHKERLTETKDKFNFNDEFQNPTSIINKINELNSDYTHSNNSNDNNIINNRKKQHQPCINCNFNGIISPYLTLYLLNLTFNILWFKSDQQQCNSTIITHQLLQLIFDSGPNLVLVDQKKKADINLNYDYCPTFWCCSQTQNNSKFQKKVFETFDLKKSENTSQDDLRNTSLNSKIHNQDLLESICCPMADDMLSREMLKLTTNFQEPLQSSSDSQMYSSNYNDPKDTTSLVFRTLCDFLAPYYVRYHGDREAYLVLNLFLTWFTDEYILLNFLPLYATQNEKTNLNPNLIYVLQTLQTFIAYHIVMNTNHLRPITLYMALQLLTILVRYINKFSVAVDGISNFSGPDTKRYEKFEHPLSSESENEQQNYETKTPSHICDKNSLSTSPILPAFMRDFVHEILVKTLLPRLIQVLETNEELLVDIWDLIFPIFYVNTESLPPQTKSMQCKTKNSASIGDFINHENRTDKNSINIVTKPFNFLLPFFFNGGQVDKNCKLLLCQEEFNQNAKFACFMLSNTPSLCSCNEAKKISHFNVNSSQNNYGPICEITHSKTDILEDTLFNSDISDFNNLLDMQQGTVLYEKLLVNTICDVSSSTGKLFSGLFQQLLATMQPSHKKDVAFYESNNYFSKPKLQNNLQNSSLILTVLLYAPYNIASMKSNISNKEMAHSGQSGKISHENLNEIQNSLKAEIPDNFTTMINPNIIYRDIFNTLIFQSFLQNITLRKIIQEKTHLNVKNCHIINGNFSKLHSLMQKYWISCQLPPFDTVLDLGEKDIISCTLDFHQKPGIIEINKEQKKENHTTNNNNVLNNGDLWFLVVYDNIMALVIPHPKLLGHGIVKISAELKDIEVANVVKDGKSLLVRTRSTLQATLSDKSVQNANKNFEGENYYTSLVFTMLKLATNISYINRDINDKTPPEKTEKTPLNSKTAKTLKTMSLQNKINPTKSSKIMPFDKERVNGNNPLETFYSYDPLAIEFHVKLTFEDTIRCRAAKNCLLRGRLRCRILKAKKIREIIQALHIGHNSRPHMNNTFEFETKSINYPQKTKNHIEFLNSQIPHNFNHDNESIDFENAQVNSILQNPFINKVDYKNNMKTSTFISQKELKSKKCNIHSINPENCKGNHSMELYYSSDTPEIYELENRRNDNYSNIHQNCSVQDSKLVQNYYSDSSKITDTHFNQSSITLDAPSQINISNIKNQQTPSSDFPSSKSTTIKDI